MVAEINFKIDLLMKRFLIFFIVLFVCLITNGQGTYIGRIVNTSNTCETGICLPSSVFGLEVSFTINYHYILTLSSLRISTDDNLIIEGTEYFVDDVVVITGTTRATQAWYSESIELEIETIKRWSPNQDIQHFLGEYILRGTRITTKPFGGIELSFYSEIVIKEGIESDLLINFSNYDTVFNAFILNNNLFIPQTWFYLFDGDDAQAVLYGKGEIIADSLFLSFFYGGPRDYGYTCECKGKKTASSGIVSPSVSDKNKVYFDATKQAIVIDETLQNQSLTFELIDMQGKVVCRKTNAGNSSIGVANLPKGIYLYRLLHNNGAIYSGKIMLK